MLENLLKQKMMNINCAIACLLDDKENFFDKYDNLNLNCGTYIASPAVNARLLAKSANINAENTLITDYSGPLVRVSGGVPGNSAEYTGKYVLIEGDMVLSADNAAVFAQAAGVVISGTLYYPDSCALSLSGAGSITGAKRAYPAGTCVIIGNRTLEKLLTEVTENAARIWVAGEVDAWDAAALATARERDILVFCDRLFTYENLVADAADIVQATELVPVPDGHAVVNAITLDEGTALLHGGRLFVRGSLMVEPRNAHCLKDFSSLIVRGRASLPVGSAADFKAVGKADSYRLYEGVLHNANGFEMFSHKRLQSMAARGEKMTVHVNGCALFDTDVTADDMDAIASFSCNGVLLIGGEAHGALSARLGSVNGAILDRDAPEFAELSLMELKDVISGSGNINAEIYVME